MKKLLLRAMLLIIAMFCFATAAFAGDWQPETVLPADGYYLAKETVIDYDNGSVVTNPEKTYSYAFDGNGNLTRMESKLEKSVSVTEYTYDARGNLSKMVFSAIYDGEEQYSNIVEYTYDSNDQLIQEEGEGAVVQYTYDSTGQLTQTITAWGNVPEKGICTYIYDTAGRLIQVNDNLNGDTTYTYDSNGMMATMDSRFSDDCYDLRTYTYDQNGYMTGWDQKLCYAGPEYTYHCDYTYDGCGNNTKIDVYMKINGKYELLETYTYEYAALGLPLDPSGFVDVVDTPSTNWYYQPVLWAVEKGVTNGISDTEFAPNDTCTRAQAVAFLWRAAGRPEPSSTANPFVDVVDTADTNWYYKAVLWAVEKGITTGTDATHFSPEGEVSRGQMVTFLWRMHEKPTAEGSTFADVPANEYYYNAVSWAVSQGITNGTDAAANTFEPLTTCSRAHIVTFLYRDQVK